MEILPIGSRNIQVTEIAGLTLSVVSLLAIISRENLFPNYEWATSLFAVSIPLLGFRLLLRGARSAEAGGLVRTCINLLAVFGLIATFCGFLALLFAFSAAAGWSFLSAILLGVFVWLLVLIA